MELTNSKNIHNRIKKRTVAMAVITHIYLAIITFGASLLLCPAKLQCHQRHVSRGNTRTVPT